MAIKKTTRLEAPQLCPVCGQEVLPRALACPECGADHHSGWKENTDLIDAIDLPDEDFNYAAFIEQEFGAPVKPVAIKPVWWIVALLLIVAFGAMYFFSASW
jgi:hypothetical protein